MSGDLRLREVWFTRVTRTVDRDSSAPKTRVGWLIALAALAAFGCTSPRAVVQEPIAVTRPLEFTRDLDIDSRTLCDMRGMSTRCRGSLPFGFDRRWFALGAYEQFAGGYEFACGRRANHLHCWTSETAREGGRLCTSGLPFNGEDVREMRKRGEHLCALSTSSELRCATFDGEELSETARISNVRAFAMDEFGACAVTPAGLECAGAGADVTLAATDLAQVVKNVLGGCIRRVDGRVACWGAAPLGPLDRDDESDEVGWREIEGLDAVDLVGGGEDVCARDASGQTLCWGENRVGQLGLGHSRVVSEPTVVRALAGATDLALGNDTLCFRRAEEAISCVGKVGIFRDERDPLRMDEPVLMPGGNADAVLTSDRICLRRGSTLRCHGGHGDGIEQTTAGEVLDVARPEAASAHLHGCTRWNDGTVECRRGARVLRRLDGVRQLVSPGGFRVFAALDDGSVVSFLALAPQAPEAVAGVRAGTDLDSSLSFICGVHQGRLSCVDHDGTPQDGFGAELRDVEEVAVGWALVCARRRGGQAICWHNDGSRWADFENIDEVIGVGTSMYVRRNGRLLPIHNDGIELTLGDPVGGFDDIDDVHGSRNNWCVHRRGGDVWCWGSNQSGQLGRLPRGVSAAFERMPDTAAGNAPPPQECLSPLQRADGEYTGTHGATP